MVACDSAPTSSWSSAGSPANEGQVSFGANVAGTAATPQVVVGVGFQGEPSVKSYSSSDPGARTGVSVMSGGKAFFSDASTAIGSWTLVLTSVSVVTSTSVEKIYTVHGSLDSTCPGSGGTSVIVHAVF
jgi:hypothetical protein